MTLRIINGIFNAVMMIDADGRVLPMERRQRCPSIMNV